MAQSSKSARHSGPSSTRQGGPRTLRSRSCRHRSSASVPPAVPLAMGRRRYLRDDDDDDDRRFSRRPDSARSPPLPRPRSSPLFDPPRLDVRAPLSAEAATRLMLEKWDLMDDLAERRASRSSSRSSSARSRQPKGRSSSLPPFEHERRRRISRVEEYERWKPERERIRLAQVEMERRLDEEKLEAQLVRHDERSESVASRSRSARSKVRQRKATPAVLGTAISSEEEQDDVASRRRGRLSALSLTASRGSPVSSWKEAQDPDGKQQSRQETKDERRSRRTRRERPPPDESPPPKARSRSSRQQRRPQRATSVPLPGLFTPAPFPPTQRAASPSPPSDTSRASRSQRDVASRPRTRSSRSRPRPTGLTPSPPPASVPTPSMSAAVSDAEPRSSRRSRSSRRRPRPSRGPSPDNSPPYTTQAATASDLLDAAASAGAAAVEQVSEAVSSALGKMLPGFFGAGK
ncbi:hypothetical protein BJY59DRAFT_404344 [Rhodotorula toruloides]